MAKVGKVKQIIGAVVDVQFNGGLAEIYNALEIKRQKRIRPRQKAGTSSFLSFEKSSSNLLPFILCHLPFALVGLQPPVHPAKKSSDPPSPPTDDRA